MRNLYFNILRSSLLLLLLICCEAVLAQQTNSVQPGKVMIKLNAVASQRIKASGQRMATNKQATTFATGITPLDAIARKYSATTLTRVFPAAGKMEPKMVRYGLDRWYVLTVDPSTPIATAVSAFKKIAEVEYVQPAFKISSVFPKEAVTRINKKSISTKDATPAPVNDPYYKLQWHYHNTGQSGGYVGADINLPEAWKVTAGTPNVIVDVVDEGVDYKHEDLAANMWHNMAEVNGQPGVDDDNNGYVDDMVGYNFADNTGTISPGDHGTHTSGTIAAVNNNGIGVAGIAGGTGNGDGARIMSSEIFGTNSSDGAASAAAIVFGANNGAVISQNSWGYNTPDVYDQAVLDAIDYFTKEAGRDVNGNQVGPMNGGVVIFAAGNSNISDPSYPGYYPTAIAVGATTVFDNKASYSNYGSWVDISAPGGDVTGANNQEVASTVANNGYGYMAGTSMACPHVSGVAALIVSKYGKPGFTNEDLKNRLFNTVDKFLALDPSYNGLMGVGRLDAGRAVQPDKALPPVPITDLKGVSNAQNSVTLNWTAPSDPDNNNAQSYIVYYAKHAFDATQKDTISKITISKALPAGSAETFTLSGLTPSTPYNISIVAKDLWANESDFSNQVQVTTLDGGIVSLPSATLTMNINITGNPKQAAGFRISNIGKGSLAWSGTPIPVSSSWAKKDGFYDTLKYNVQSYAGGYIGDDEQVPFSAATRFDVRKKAFNLTHVANYIQTQGIVAPITISVYRGGDDPSKGQLLITQQMDAVQDWSLTVTKLNGMFLFQPGEWFWVVYEYDPAYAFSQGYESGAPDSLANYFLTSSDHGQKWKNISSQYQPVRFFTSALTNEGYFGNLVALTPSSGSIAGNGNINTTVNADATTVRNGTYNFRLQVNSNDLNTPIANTPLVVNVSGQQAKLTSREGNLDCKAVFIGKDGNASIKLFNTGLDKLHTFTFASTNALFTKASLPDTLYPGDSSVITVTFKPLVAGLQQSKITLGSNGGTLILSATGTGVEPPVMTLSAMPVQIAAKADSIGQNTFTIANKTGKYPLNYSFPEISAISKARIAGKLAQGAEPYGQYVWIDNQEAGGPVYSWDDISHTGTDITPQLSTDAKTAKLVNIGFPLNIYGDTISQLYVTGMGMLSFNYPGSLNANSSSLPLTNDGVNGCIAALWLQSMDPVISGNEKVFIKYEPGKFIVQYNDVEYFAGSFFGGGSSSQGKATFQVVLYSNGKIAMNYKEVSNAMWATYSVIGLENKAETKGFNVTDYTSANPWTPQDQSSLWIVPVAPQFITAVTPQAGAVAIGDSVKITVTVSAKGLIDSVYHNTLALTTNDPLQETADIPVQFTVTGVEGMLQKTDSLNFGNLFNGGTATQEAVFMNTGSSPVTLLSASSNNPAFTTTLHNATVPPMSELRIPVTFSPAAIAPYTGKLTVTTDNAAQSTFTVQLDGNGTAAPSLSYTFTGGESKTLNIDQTAPGSVKLTNNGASDLQVMIEHPQWLQITGQILADSVKPDSAHTYTIHKTVDSSTASYNWIELSQGLGKQAVTDVSAVPYQQVQLPFTFPYFGKNYNSLYLTYFGDVFIKQPQIPMTGIYSGVPSPLEPNGIMATGDVPMVPYYDGANDKVTGAIYYYSDTSKLVVEFYKMEHYNFFANGYATYETVYYKDGRIKTMFKEGETTANFTDNFVMGIENEAGTDGVMAYNHGIFFKDHGVIEYVPSAGYTLKAGASVTLPSTWTTLSMTDGVYNDHLHIVTNDPKNKQIDIPLQLTVIGAYNTTTSDSVAFGKVVSATDADGNAVTYSKPVSIANSGTKNITISNIDFSNNTNLVLQESPDYPFVLAPGEIATYHIVFTPDNSLSAVKEKLQISTDRTDTPVIYIPVTATVIQPPVIHTDSSQVRITMQQHDTATRTINISNQGAGEMDYQISADYHRPGIAYNSVPKMTAADSLRSKKINTLQTAPGIRITAAPSFADSIIQYNPGPSSYTFLGTADDNDPLVSDTRFNAGKKGFALSHIGNLYRTDAQVDANVKLRVKIGTNVNTATVIYEQSVNLTADTVGHYTIVKLDSSIIFNPYEDFFVEWEYAPGMRYPQGVQFVAQGEMKDNIYYRKSLSSSAFMEEYYAMNYYVNAYAEKDTTTGWLTISPDTASVAVHGTQPLTITVNGNKVTPKDQSVALQIHSNDPATPVAKVDVHVHIDQAPYLTKHDTIVTSEADTLNYNIPATDEEGSRIAIKLLTADSTATLNHTDTADYFVYTPTYQAAGLRKFAITLTDDQQNVTADTLIVKVLNVNRAPVVTHHLAKRTIYISAPAVKINLDTVFTDPDNDSLTYTGGIDTTNRVQTLLEANGHVTLIPSDTGSAMLVFIATDAFAGTANDTLLLTILKTRAPQTVKIPNMIIEIGTPRTLELDAFFAAADSIATWTYTADVDSASLATANVNAQTLLLNGLQTGNTLVTVQATGNNGSIAQSTFLLTVVDNKGDIINSYHISVAPNPIRSTANVHMELGTDKNVRIDIVGMNGHLQGLLFEGKRSAGSSNLQADLSGLAAGNYLLRFTIDGKVGLVQIAKL